MVVRISKFKFTYLAVGNTNRDVLVEPELMEKGPIIEVNTK